MLQNLGLVRFAVGTSVVFCLVGCGTGQQSGPPTVRVSGTVTLQGKPLSGAEVTFVGKGFSGYGVTNSEGKYELVQGAVAGPNKITISKFEGKTDGLDPDIADDPEQLKVAAASAKSDPSLPKAALAEIPHETIPPEFSDPQKTKLTFTVPEGGTTSADFRL